MTIRNRGTRIRKRAEGDPAQHGEHAGDLTGSGCVAECRPPERGADHWFEVQIGARQVRRDVRLPVREQPERQQRARHRQHPEGEDREHLRRRRGSAICH
jgi:hypothetical protein